MEHALTQQSEIVRAAALALDGGPHDYDPLLAMARDARLVLIGEASHGTQEFYHERARITARLIAECGFNAVAAEADWPDAYRLNCFVRGRGADRDPTTALGDFRRFPTWMWRNAEVCSFLEWLREYNLARSPAERAGFYGLDLYNLSASIEAVLAYLDRVDPAAARLARSRYACFEHYRVEPALYGYAVQSGAADPCEAEAVAQLVALQRRSAASADPHDEEARFVAEQNARLARGAEAYYREMYRGQVSAWNLRDTHMAETLGALMGHLEAQAGQARVVVWAHNSHLGDARATEMGARGELNLGQLVRERYGDAALLVGFSTYHGTVTAAADWDLPGLRRLVRPGLPGSYEALLHRVGGAGRPLPRFMLDLRDGGAAAGVLHESRLQRAIGVVYRPETERLSHYFYARLPEQFDALIHIDETHALEPLERALGEGR